MEEEKEKLPQATDGSSVQTPYSGASLQEGVPKPAQEEPERSPSSEEKCGPTYSSTGGNSTTGGNSAQSKCYSPYSSAGMSQQTYQTGSTSIVEDVARNLKIIQAEQAEKEAVREAARERGEDEEGFTQSQSLRQVFTNETRVTQQSHDKHRHLRPSRRDRRSTSMRLAISPALLRGVKLTDVLAWGGRHLEPGLQSFGSANLLSFSSQRSDISLFISHCWRDSRWSKFVALSIVHNGNAAYLMSLIVSLILCVLQRINVLPMIWDDTVWVIAGEEHRLKEGFWCIFVSPIVFLISVIFWQNVRDLFRHPMWVFLDKLCIHQTDEVQKAEGIRGIGGILKQSERMEVLWSPQYFYRLWCMFEVAVWCYLNRCDQLLFVPLAKTALLPLGMLFLYVALMILLVNSVLGEQGFKATIVIGIGLMMFVPVMVHLVRRIMRELFELKDQLAKMSIKDSQCFCCTHKHIHPETKARLQCDRDLVMNTVMELFPGEDSCQEFDHKFRSQFVKRVIETIGGPDSMPFRGCMLMVAPLLWRGFDVCAVSARPDIQFRMAFTRLCYIMEGIVWVRFFLCTCGFLAKKRQNWWHDIFISCLGAIVAISTGAALYAKSHKAQQLKPHWPQLLNGFLLLGFVVALFWCEFSPPPKKHNDTRTGRQFFHLRGSQRKMSPERHASSDRLSLSRGYSVHSISSAAGNNFDPVVLPSPVNTANGKKDVEAPTLFSPRCKPCTPSSKMQVHSS